MFKSNWERPSDTHPFSPELVKKMVHLAFPGEKLVRYDLITEGCANLNFKILLKDKRTPFILRIYLRNKETAHTEQKVAELLKWSISAPLTYYIGACEGYHFAITTFIGGIRLSDFLLRDRPHCNHQVMFDVGTTLAKINHHRFSQAGVFDENLKINPHHSLTNFVKNFLNTKSARDILGSKIASHIVYVFDRYEPLLPDNNDRNLVHGDFDPSNLLIHQTAKGWRVNGVLDWEFSFSGSSLWDMANMLRYAHKMSPDFEKNFLKGVARGGLVLRENWEITIGLLTIVSLLDCLERADPQNQPNKCADIYNLINYNLKKLNANVPSKTY